MGFPLGWTAGVSRTQRLKMLGNAVQVQCGEVVGALLMEMLLATSAAPEGAAVERGAATG